MFRNPVPSLPEVSAFVRDDHRRVLVVDDNADLTRTTSVLLGCYGFIVATARDGHAAIQTALTFRPHIILLDIGLPGMDGYQVAKVLRSNAKTRDAIIVAISAYDRNVHPGRSGQTGFDHRFVKPVDFDVLLSVFNSSPSLSS